MEGAEAMTDRILMISHNPPPLTDRAHDWASANGFEVDARFPFLGDTLPASTEGYAGSVIYGGRFNADSEAENPFLHDEYRWIDMSLAADQPILGICLGAQMIARHLGADVGPLPDGRVEFGFYEIRPMHGAEDFLPGPMTVTQSHFHQFGIPSGAERLAESDLFPNQAFRYGAATIGIQFHPEAPAALFRAWQDRYPSHYDRPGCQSRAEQDALAEAVQARQARWFEGLLTGMFRRPSPSGPARQE
jgi:GMP synthase (glutamine-hydrolysing)